jgi:hypothetical protein
MPDDSQDRDDAVLLGVLVDDHPGQCASDELERELAWEGWRVEDALARLERVGLVHRHGDFAFASRAAARGRQLDA